MVLLRLLHALLIVCAVIGPPILFATLPLTRFGWCVLSILCIPVLLLWLLTPDLVYSLRADAQIGLLQHLRLRLTLAPVWKLIGASRILLRQNSRYPITVFSKVAALHPGHSPEQLAAEVDRSSYPQARERSASLYGSEPSSLTIKVLLGQLLAAALGMGVLGFFFYVSSGLEYLDIAFIDRDWQETPATLKSQSSEGGYRNAYYVYHFGYAVGSRSMEAQCYGADEISQDAELVALFDRRQPQVAVLKNGLRTKDLPFAAAILGCLSLLVIVPLPLLLGHLLSTIFFGTPQRLEESV